MIAIETIKNINLPMYKKIALDLATRISKGEFDSSKKLYGYSVLAGEYNVSPETIRRAMALLRDMDVVEIKHGSGIFLKSIKKSHSFIEKYHDKNSINSLRNDIDSLLKEKESIEKKISDKTNKIIDYSDKLKNTNPINPIEIKLTKDSHLIGKTISESQFWQNTGATIVGIRRGDSLTLSPGPYMDFERGDSILAIGPTSIINTMQDFIEEKNE